MKSMLQSVCLLLALLSPLSQGHMWLRTPLSRGGINNIGGTTGPCNGLQAGSGTKTTYEVGQSVTFQFRVNQHGPNPFKFALSTSGDTFSTVLVDNIPNTVTAGADGFQGVNVAVTIPNTICSNCAIQLSGMGQTSGSGTWYNCADIEIVAAGQGGFPLVTGVSPATGATAGGTTVTVTGSRFGSSQSTQKCKFGSTIVAATWISDTSLTCVSPIYNVPTEVALEVSRDGTTYSSSGEIFTYTGDALPPVVSSISPKKGDIGTPLIIDGQNFFSSDVQCKFGNVTVSAHYVSQTRVTCTVPYLDPSVSYTTVEVNVDGSPYSTSGVTFTISTRSGSASFLQPFSFLVFIAAALLAFLRF